MFATTILVGPILLWYGIRMARSLNNDFLEPLADTFPAHRKGELGDVAKANCTTCHQGAYKPLNGTPMVANYPELVGPVAENVAVK